MRLPTSMSLTSLPSSLLRVFLPLTYSLSETLVGFLLTLLISLYFFYHIKQGSKNCVLRFCHSVKIEMQKIESESLQTFIKAGSCPTTHDGWTCLVGQNYRRVWILLNPPSESHVQE